MSHIEFRVGKKNKRMNIPSQLLYTKDHEWVKIEGDIATVGITDFAQGELGDIVYVEIETLGQTVFCRRGLRVSGSSENSLRFNDARLGRSLITK